MSESTQNKWEQGHFETPGSEVVSHEEVMRPDPVAGLGKWQKAIKVTYADGTVKYFNEHGHQLK